MYINIYKYQVHCGKISVGKFSSQAEERERHTGIITLRTEVSLPFKNTVNCMSSELTQISFVLAIKCQFIPYFTFLYSKRE